MTKTNQTSVAAGVAFSIMVAAAAVFAPAQSAHAAEPAHCVTVKDGFTWSTCDNEKPRRVKKAIAPGAAGPVPAPIPGGAPAAASTDVEPQEKEIFIPPAQRDLDGGGGEGR